MVGGWALKHECTGMQVWPVEELQEIEEFIGNSLTIHEEEIKRLQERHGTGEWR